MPNRVRRQTKRIRRETLAELRRIYGSEWNEISGDVERFVNEMYLDPEESTQVERQQYAERHGKGKLVAIIAAAAVLANGKAINRINSGVGRVYTINADDVASYVKQKTGVSLYTKDVSVASKLSKYTKRRYNQATDSKFVSREVMRDITRMLQEGKGTKEIQKRLEQVYNFNKQSAYRTTRTETTRFQSGGRYDTMVEADKKGFVFKKVWRHGGNPKEPRDWHVAMDGEMQDLDKLFSNGLMFPGEAGADPEETINCGCYLDEELVSW